VASSLFCIDASCPLSSSMPSVRISVMRIAPLIFSSRTMAPSVCSCFRASSSASIPSRRARVLPGDGADGAEPTLTTTARVGGQNVRRSLV
jgi:hypothetical protein